MRFGNGNTSNGRPMPSLEGRDRTKLAGGRSRCTRGAGVLAALLVFMVLGAFPAGASETDCDGILPDFLCDSDREARPEGHVAPMSMPYLFEDPYITTELNLVGIYHNFPADSVFDGGEAGVIALQARIAITDRLAFIATKDGYTFLRPDNSILNNEEGFMDITAGLKYAVIDDREKGLIVTPSFRYEVPLGNDGVLQGKGKGVVIPAVSVGYGPDNLHLVADLGAQIAVDGDKDSSSLFYNIHLDQAFEVDCIPGAKFVVPFIELNGMSWVDSGDGSATLQTDLGRLSVKAAQNALAAGLEDRRFEGADVANLGSTRMAGETLITMAWGIRVPFENGFSTGMSYERAISQRHDIFEQRWTWMVSYDF
ncbi:MAG TPA: hypothetical protein ENI85_17520 [Deltaproteobacteria bacterium]|nr:hypothetical protein [Deltaproteobacteria bacterium]